MNQVFWVVTLCCWMNPCRRFQRSKCIHLQSQVFQKDATDPPKMNGAMILRTASNYSSTTSVTAQKTKFFSNTNVTASIKAKETGLMSSHDDPSYMTSTFPHWLPAFLGTSFSYVCNLYLQLVADQTIQRVYEQFYRSLEGKHDDKCCWEEEQQAHNGTSASLQSRWQTALCPPLFCSYKSINVGKYYFLKHSSR